MTRTLVRGDSFTGFAVRYCLRHVGRSLLMVALLPLAAALGWRRRTRGGSLLLWAMTVGVPTRRFAEAIREYAIHTLSKRVYEQVFVELERHARVGNAVVATGSIPLMVRALLRARGAPRVPVVGTRLKRRFGGLVADTHCIGRTKVRELDRRLGLKTRAAVYTDSVLDHPLMRRAGYVTLVGPTPRTLRRVEYLLGPSIPLQALHLCRFMAVTIDVIATVNEDSKNDPSPAR